MTIWRHLTQANRWSYRALSSPVCAAGLGITLLAAMFAATVYLLGHRSLWADEFFSIWFAQPDWTFSRTLAESIATDPQPPLYYSLLHFWIGWFGNGPVAVRSLNLLGFALLATAMRYSWRTSIPRVAWLLFWSLMLTSRFLWDFAAEARAYFLVICASALLTVLSYDFAVQIGKKRALRAWPFGMFSLVALIASGLHYYGFIAAGSLIAALFGYALLERRYKTAALFVGIGALLLVTEIAWIAYSFPRLWINVDNFWIIFRPISETRLFLTSTFSANVLLLLFITVAAVVGFRKIIKDRPLMVVVAALCIGYLAVLGLSLHQPILFNRYLSAFAPQLIYISTVVLCRGLSASMLLPTMASIFIISLPIAVARSLPDRENWRGAAAYITAQYGADCNHARFMMTHSHAPNFTVTYLAKDRDWSSVPFTQAGFDEAMATRCPVVGWTNQASTRWIMEHIAKIDRHGHRIEIVPFTGIFLIVAQP